jgi:2,4-dienoyl-CoA reductase-like NADH-dependent reductase (Old Yellow Enzyme family)
MWSGQATSEGRVTPQIIEYHRVRASAGCGLVIVEHSFVAPPGRHTPTQIGCHSDDMTEGLSRLASAIRGEGAGAALQISHAGSRATGEVLGGLRPAAPSAVRHPYEPAGKVPDALNRGQIREIVGAFGSAAARALSAGFDAVEIHAAHGFLLSEFLSPLTNLREDEYGGGVEGRARLHLEVLAEVRRRVGLRFPVFVRLGAHDETPGGLELNDACRAAALLAEAGAGLIDVSGGLQGSRGAGKDPGYFVPYAAAIKGAVSVPVMVTGGIRDPRHADRIVRQEEADLVGIGRGMLEDPDWARKAIAELSR